MGRNKNKSYEKNIKQVRFNQYDFDKMNAITKKYFKGNFSQFVKFHVNNPYDYDLNKPIEDKKNRSHIIRLLANCANNLNQIARFLNVNSYRLDRINLTDINEELSSIESIMIDMKQILKNE